MFFLLFNLYYRTSPQTNALTITAALNTYMTVLFCWFFQFLILYLFFYFQRTRFHMDSPLLIWAPSWRWLKKPALPPCCVPPVETQTQRSPGSKTCFPWTSVTATGALNSFAQVQFDGIVLPFCFDLIWTVSQVALKTTPELFMYQRKGLKIKKHLYHNEV